MPRNSLSYYKHTHAQKDELEIRVGTFDEFLKDIHTSRLLTNLVMQPGAGLWLGQ